MTCECIELSMTKQETMLYHRVEKHQRKSKSPLVRWRCFWKCVYMRIHLHFCGGSDFGASVSFIIISAYPTIIAQHFLWHFKLRQRRSSWWKKIVCTRFEWIHRNLWMLCQVVGSAVSNRHQQIFWCCYKINGTFHSRYWANFFRSNRLRLHSILIRFDMRFDTNLCFHKSYYKNDKHCWAVTKSSEHINQVKL